MKEPNLMPTDNCVWTQYCDGGEWSTDCGKAFVMEEGSPAENGMKFCCFCGKSLEEHIVKEDDEEPSDKLSDQ